MTEYLDRQWIVQEGGERLDKYLADGLANYSRSALQKLIAEGLVLVNGAPAKASNRLERGDEITAHLPVIEAPSPKPQPIALDVLYEDDDLLVINKPAGMVVHPAPGHEAGTLVNAVLARCPELALEGGERPGIVHRLDRDTSGLILVAKNEAAKAKLQAQFRRRDVHKVYLALLHGDLQPPDGIIEAPIGRNPRARNRMAVVTEGRPAKTSYHVRAHYPGFTLVEAAPETGRTHQIRVHFAAIGYPVAGDTVYGPHRRALGLKRQFLHAWQLTFALPGSGEVHTFTAPLPGDLERVLDRLGKS
jgi:23S rRNA pseudouridine1911/1915/1917 synthase